MSRIIRCVKPVFPEYITVGEDYTYSHNKGYNWDQIYYKRVTDGAGSFMNTSRFKRALRDGEIVFVDNLPKEQQ